MYYQTEETFCRPTIWLNIDPLKVKQRIDAITLRLEEVLRQFELEIEIDNSFLQNKS